MFSSEASQAKPERILDPGQKQSPAQVAVADGLARVGVGDSETHRRYLILQQTTILAKSQARVEALKTFN